MSSWISVLDKNGDAESLHSPDGTVIEIYNDKNIIITPDGYRVQINLYPPEFIIRGRLDSHKGKEFYEKLFNTTK